MLSKESSNVINLLKCMMCISVVYIHSQIVNRYTGGVIHCNTGIYERFQHCFANTFLDHTCVPLFFCISGYLFFLNKPSGNLTDYFKGKLSKRINSLLVPYIIANLITIMVLYLLSSFRGNDPLVGYGNILNAIIGNHSEHSLPIDAPLWYLRNLIAIVLLSPVIFYTLRYIRYVFLLILTASWLFLDINLFHIWVDSDILFFSIGAYLALREYDLITLLKPNSYGYLYVLLYGIILYWTEQTENAYLLKISTLVSFPAWISLAYYLSKIFYIKVSSFFVTSTFFVFMYHYYLPQFFKAIFFHFFPYTNVSMFVAFALIPVLVTFVLTLFYYCFNKKCNRLASLMVGGR